MHRAITTVALLVLTLTAVAAQSNPISERRSLMKSNGDQAKIGAAMIKGQTPFDQAKAHAVFANFIDVAGKMPNLFPDNSKAGGDTAAAPKIWQDMPAFKARFEKLATDSKEAQAATKDLDSFKAAFAKVGKDCADCHESYRIKKD